MDILVLETSKKCWVKSRILTTIILRDKAHIMGTTMSFHLDIEVGSVTWFGFFIKRNTIRLSKAAAITLSPMVHHFVVIS